MKLNESLREKQIETKRKFNLHGSINEVGAVDDAHKLGLTSIGFGRWADKSGKVVAKSVKDKLVPVKNAQAGDPADRQSSAKKNFKPIKAKSDAPSKSSDSLPIHRDFKPTASNGNVPDNRPKVLVNPDADPTQTAQPTAAPVKRSEPKISSADRAAAGDFDPKAKKVDPSVGPKLDRDGNPVKAKNPADDTQRKFKPLVKGADGKWGSGEPAQPKVSSDDRAAAGDYNADDDQSLDRNKPSAGQSKAQAGFKGIPKKKDKMSLGGVMKGVKDKFR
jgi:hypothetical protein|tara:strand:+ start:5857 stop:6684 length:828 start_codon:yes stop_codon:yes gene_type:complete